MTKTVKKLSQNRPNYRRKILFVVFLIVKKYFIKHFMYLLERHMYIFSIKNLGKNILPKP